MMPSTMFLWMYCATYKTFFFYGLVVYFSYLEITSALYDSYWEEILSDSLLLSSRVTKIEHLCILNMFSWAGTAAQCTQCVACHDGAVLSILQSPTLANLCMSIGGRTWILWRPSDLVTHSISIAKKSGRDLDQTFGETLAVDVNLINWHFSARIVVGIVTLWKSLRDTRCEIFLLPCSLLRKKRKDRWWSFRRGTPWWRRPAGRRGSRPWPCWACPAASSRSGTCCSRRRNRSKSCASPSTPSPVRGRHAGFLRGFFGLLFHVFVRLALPQGSTKLFGPRTIFRHHTT